MILQYRIIGFARFSCLLLFVGSGFLCATGRLSAQAAPRYLVLFADKKASPFSLDKPEAFLSGRAIERRERQGIPVSEADLPVNPSYIAGVKATGAHVFYPTRWFNGVIVSATAGQLEQIRKLPYFKGIERDMALTKADYVATRSPAGSPAVRKMETAEDIRYGNSRTQLDMLGIPTLHKRGYTGSGILIAVLDGGFVRADEQGYLEHLYDKKGVVETYDFVTGNPNVYDDHYHGLQVLSVMAAKSDGVLVGAAYDAEYLLYRTENNYSETPYEEAMWLVAAERADSLGADIVNTSLGYNTFDDATLNYTYAQMDGRTALISKAARKAARTGMLLVVSAGNEGNDAWRYITAPADVDSVLTVGAVTASMAYASLSSVGPNAEGVIKPDVAAMGVGVAVGGVSGGATRNQGTSFSAPLIAGMAALLWQKYPDKTAGELMALIKSMGNNTAKPDSLLGYGIPFFSTIDAPTGLKAEVTENRVALSWNAVEGAAAYEVERAADDGAFTRIATVAVSSYQSDTVLVSSSYSYRVRAVTNEEASFFSEPVTVQVLITGTEPEGADVLLYPNPVTADMCIRFGGILSEGWTIEVVSVSGRNIIPVRTAVFPETRLDLDLVSSGLYILKITGPNGIVRNLRFVKK